MAKKFYIATFGCRTNQADSAALREDLLSREFEETRECRQADVIVVNSCTVTHRSDQQVRQLTRSLRRQNPAARLVVTGCYAQRDPSSLARITGVDAVVGNSHKGDIGSIVSALECEEIHPPDHGEIAAIYRENLRFGRPGFWLAQSEAAARPGRASQRENRCRSSHSRTLGPCQRNSGVSGPAPGADFHE